MQQKKKLYFGCALMGLPKEHRDRMEAFRESLKEYFDVLEFRPAGTPPEDLYNHDIRTCVANCDFMIAFVDERSTGLGYEMGTAIERYGKPVLALAQMNSEVSSLIRGIQNSRFQFSRYNNFSDALAILLRFAKSLQ